MPHRTEVRDAEIVEQVARGGTHAAVAANHSLSRQRVTQIAQENRDYINQRQEELRLRAIETIDGHWEPM